MSALPQDLGGWLAHLERLHPHPIQLGLDRVRQVWEAMALALPGQVITVGGTNGKGSTCALIEAMLLAGGYRVGCYTSPHLIRYNERVRIDGRMVDDADLCAAFAAVEAARGEVSLTYFEFGTLAAAWLFARQPLDAVVLEVGMGGRLDAVNVFDPDIAVVCTVDLDHMAYLGETREKIGLEKAGIFRPGRCAVCGDPDPPATLVEHARTIGARLQRLGIDFEGLETNGGWSFRGPAGVRSGLPLPTLRGVHQLRNAATALAALDCLAPVLPLSQAQIRAGLLSARVPGRFQVFPGRPTLVLDVAHNPQAAAALADSLRRQPCAGRTIAVFGMLRDKDIGAVIRCLAEVIDLWCVGGLDGPRGASAEHLAQQLEAAGVGAVRPCDDIGAAYQRARWEAGENDRICAFGSFYTVAAVLKARGAKD